MLCKIQHLNTRSPLSVLSLLLCKTQLVLVPSFIKTDANRIVSTIMALYRRYLRKIVICLNTFSLLYDVLVLNVFLFLNMSVPLRAQAPDTALVRRGWIEDVARNFFILMLVTIVMIVTRKANTSRPVSHSDRSVRSHRFLGFPLQPVTSHKRLQHNNRNDCPWGTSRFWTCDACQSVWRSHRPRVLFLIKFNKGRGDASGCVQHNNLVAIAKLERCIIQQASVNWYLRACVALNAKHGPRDHSGPPAVTPSPQLRRNWPPLAVVHATHSKHFVQLPSKLI
jgi:hypothetical protein